MRAGLTARSRRVANERQGQAPASERQVQAVFLLKFTPDAADYWDGPKSKMVRAFGLNASVIAGKPVAMGEHGSHIGLSDPTPA